MADRETDKEETDRAKTADVTDVEDPLQNIQSKFGMFLSFSRLIIRCRLDYIIHCT